MKLEDQVCSYEQAKRLKELGIKQNSVFYWSDKFDDDGSWRLWFNSFNDHTCLHEDLCSAFTVAELGVLLPAKIAHTFYEGGSYSYDKEYLCVFDGETEAQARAAMLIHLLENNLITAEEINARL